MDQTWAKDKCKQPEDNYQQDLDHGHQDEEYNIDWDGKLKGVYQIEV